MQYGYFDDEKREYVITKPDDGKWKIFLTAGEVKKLRQWYRMQKSNAATAERSM